MITYNFCIIVSIIVYLLIMLTVGFMFSKNNSSSEDFYLGGRKLGPLVTAMSAEASDMSSWLLMGIPGLAYLSGICDVFWTVIGLGIGTWLNWFFVARRLRRYSSNLNAITIPEFYSKRYHDNQNAINAIAALTIVIFFVPYTASGFAACGKLFNSLFGVDYMTAMIFSAIIIAGYTIMGGFRAVATTDFIQSCVMTIALAVVLIYATSKAGGTAAVMDNAKTMAGYLSLNAMHDVESGGATPYGFITIISTMAWGLGYFGMPHILLRFMAIEDEKKLVLSRRVASIWVFIAMFAAICIGVVGNAVSKAQVMETLEGSASETVIVKIAGLIAENGVFPALVAGVILAGILAATMSTADSQMLAAASSVSQNIVQDFFKIKLSEKKNLLVARITILVICVIAVFLAKDPDSSVFGIVSFAWAGFGGAFGAMTLCALFWKRSNKWGALAGVISGGVMVFVWKFLVRPLGGAWNIYELLPAFIVSFICIVVVSLATAKPDDSIEKEFDAVKEA